MLFEIAEDERRDKSIGNERAEIAVMMNMSHAFGMFAEKRSALTQEPVIVCRSVCLSVHEEERSGSSSVQATRLFLVHFDHVVVFHFQLFRRVRVTDTTAVEKEAQRCHRHTLSFKTTDYVDYTCVLLEPDKPAPWSPVHYLPLAPSTTSSA